jgi:hypothetical protein
LGFQAGSDPVGELLGYLNETITLRPGARINKAIQLPLYVVMPDKKDFNNNKTFALPWGSGLSWVVGLESNISGLNHFLTVTHRRNKGKSRSGEGLQVESSIHNQGYHHKDYLTGLFSKFRRKVIGK